MTAFQSVGNQNRLVDRVVNEITRAVLEKQIEPGMFLPPERDLAEQMGVSRTVLREAVRILVTRGLLESKHGMGTRVRRITPAQIAETLRFYVQTHTPTISAEQVVQGCTCLERELAGPGADNPLLEALLEACRQL